MNIRNISRISAILAPARKLPLFSMANLAGSEKNNSYLKTLLSRYVKRGEILRLKKGWYVMREFIANLERRGAMTDYLEWVSIKLHEPSYLSLDYILSQHNVITEMPQAITAVASNKPLVHNTALGKFTYRHIKPLLFDGFSVLKKGPFYIPTATLAKALFDWLYLRQHMLSDARGVKELRLNGAVLKPSDWRELNNWCQRARSKRMTKIYKLVYAEYNS